MSSPVLREGERDDVAGVRLVEARALAVGRDLVDDTLVAGRGEDVAGLDRPRAPRCTCPRDRRTSSTCRRRRPDRSCRPARCRRTGRRSVPAQAHAPRAPPHRRTWSPCRPSPTLRTLPSLPLPAHNVPSGAGDHRPQKRRRGLGERPTRTGRGTSGRRCRWTDPRRHLSGNRPGSTPSRKSAWRRGGRRRSERRPRRQRQARRAQERNAGAMAGDDAKSEHGVKSQQKGNRHTEITARRPAPRRRWRAPASR